MPTWLLYSVFPLIFVLSSTALFFFTLTRGTLIMRSVMGRSGDTNHVYPIYSNMRLIRLIDYQPISAAILLFQYDRLVSLITSGLSRMKLDGKSVLITSCAFGNVIPKVVKASIEAGARQVLIADIIKNELTHANSKLSDFNGKVQLLEENATAMKMTDAMVDVNVIFFLLHELPNHLKEHALREALRVLAPGGKLYLAEFHRPSNIVMRSLSWTYFQIFEPLALALWNTHDPLDQIEAMGGFTCERHTLFFGNFQVLVATKDS